METAQFEQTLTNLASRMLSPQPVSTPAVTSPQNVLFGVAIVLVGILTLRGFSPQLSDFWSARFNPRGAAGEAVPDLAAEEKTFSEFASALATGPCASASAAPTEAWVPPWPTKASIEETRSKTERDFLGEFLGNAPKDLATMRKLFAEASRAPTEAARQELLGQLGCQFQALKDKAGLPVLLPIWQLASSLEGLLKQLADKSCNVSQSSLRTVASALDLLSALCVRGLKPDLATAPAVRLLSVDDDPISLKAVSFALRKVFTQPDLANDGEAALVRINAQAYDVIFLDVQMPGMDGFELCARIHETAANQTTPVVFVTCQSDFNARATSSLTGGQDLIGKPFLSFELAVKAFTLVLRRRLQPNWRPADPSPAAKTLSLLPACLADDQEQQVVLP